MAMMFLDTLCGHIDTDGRGMIVTLCAHRHRDGFVCCPRGRISADARRQLPKSQVIICPCRARGGMAHALGLEMPDGKEKGEEKPAQFLTGTEGFVLLRDGKEHFLLSCSILPSEISFPAGGEGHWAGRGGSPEAPRNVLSLQGTSCPGQVAAGTQGQNSSVQGGTSLLIPCPQSFLQGGAPW